MSLSPTSPSSPNSVSSASKVLPLCLFYSDPSSHLLCGPLWQPPSRPFTFPNLFIIDQPGRSSLADLIMAFPCLKNPFVLLLTHKIQSAFHRMAYMEVLTFSSAFLILYSWQAFLSASQMRGTWLVLACNSWSGGHEFEPHVGHSGY